jgi:hypothetical protein
VTVRSMRDQLRPTSFAGGGPVEPAADVVSGGAGIVGTVFGASSVLEGGLGAGLHWLSSGDASHIVSFGAQRLMLHGSELGSMSHLAERLADWTTSEVNSQLQKMQCH